MHAIYSELKQVLVDLAANDKLPLDMTQFDPSVFSGVIEPLLKKVKGEDDMLFGWHIDDIKEQAKGNKIKLTDDEAREVMRAIEAGHDATIGVNWDVIDFHIDQFVEDRKKEQKQKKA